MSKVRDTINLQDLEIFYNLSMQIQTLHTNHYYISICLTIFPKSKINIDSVGVGGVGASECSLDSVNIKDNYTSCSWPALKQRLCLLVGGH